jgi:hypothetical protein
MELAVVVLHGLGSQERGFEEELKDAVSARLARLGKDPAVVAWQPIYWADVLEPKELGFLRRADADHELRWMRARTLVVRGLGDAAAYQFVREPTAAYAEIHDRIRARIGELYADALGGEPVPMVVLAHSLGSHIISSYIWDTQEGHATGAAPDGAPFERMGWLAGMVTFGSTIPLFTFAHDEVKPIAFPGADLPVRYARLARWLNYFDPDDVLGYPLGPINEAYAKLVHDEEINVGNLVESWNPLSHDAYWDDRDFTRPVAEYLATFL